MPGRPGNRDLKWFKLERMREILGGGGGGGVGSIRRQRSGFFSNSAQLTEQNATDVFDMCI